MDSKNKIIPIITDKITPPKDWEFIDFNELWQHRNLFFNLISRDLKILYSNTWLGAAWIILKPLSTALVLIVILGSFVRVPTNGLPYPAVVLSGLIPWFYFSTVIIEANSSMINNSYLLNKVYFPRIILPMVPLITNLVNFLVMQILIFGLLALYGFYPNIKWLLIPVDIIIMIILSFGFSLWISALSSRFRDLLNLLPVIIQIGMYITPTFYLTSLIPKNLIGLYIFNPLVGIIDLMRWILLDYGQFPKIPLIISISFGTILVISGLFLFQRMQNLVADII